MYLLRHSHTQVQTYAGMCSLRYLLCTHAFSPGHEVAAAGTCCTSSTHSSESLIRAHPHSLETCCATQTQHSRNLCCIIKAWKWNILRWRDAWQVARPANCRKDLRLFAILENLSSCLIEIFQKCHRVLLFDSHMDGWLHSTPLHLTYFLKKIMFASL